MDYEKAYRDALSRAKDCHVNKKFSELDNNAQELCEYIFPELKVNDEMIRKELINFIEKEANSATLNANRLKFKSMLTWLEKQDPKKYEEELEKAYKYADEVQYRKGYEDAKQELDKQGERDPMWSDENEKIRKEMMGFVVTNTVSNDQRRIKYLRWLDKQGEQMPTWSVEDDKMIRRIKQSLSCYKNKVCGCSLYDDVEAEINWLNSLKPQPHWKPTEEQLMALRDAIDNNEMESLYDDLKKL